MPSETMFLTCEDCRGSGRWFDMPPAKQVRDGSAPSTCTGCDGWGLVPTTEGRPFFEMVLAMRRSPRWR